MASENKEKTEDKKEVCNTGCNNKVMIIAGVIFVVAVGLFMLGGGNDKADKTGGKKAMKQEMAAVDEDGWVKVLRANSSDIVVMQFVLRNLPQCSYFHFKTLSEGRAVGIRCFEKSDKDKPDFYFALSGTSEFLGPYKNEKEMLGKIDEMISSLTTAPAPEEAPVEAPTATE